MRTTKRVLLLCSLFLVMSLFLARPAFAHAQTSAPQGQRFSPTAPAIALSTSTRISEEGIVCGISLTSISFIRGFAGAQGTVICSGAVDIIEVAVDLDRSGTIVSSSEDVEGATFRAGAIATEQCTSQVHTWEALLSVYVQFPAGFQPPAGVAVLATVPVNVRC